MFRRRRTRLVISITTTITTYSEPRDATTDPLPIRTANCSATTDPHIPGTNAYTPNTTFSSTSTLVDSPDEDEEDQTLPMHYRTLTRDNIEVRRDVYDGEKMRRKEKKSVR
jgi:hypothetical protein